MHGMLQPSTCFTPYIQPQIPATEHHLYYYHPIISGKMEILPTGYSQLKMWIPNFTLNKWDQTSRVKDRSVRNISHNALSLTFLLPECYFDIVTQFYKIHLQLYKQTQNICFPLLFWSIFMILQQILIQCQIGLFNFICFIFTELNTNKPNILWNIWPLHVYKLKMLSMWSAYCKPVP
jgi:hypothetical protein